MPKPDDIYDEYDYLQVYTEMLLELSRKAISNIEKINTKEDLIFKYNFICNGLKGSVKNTQEISSINKDMDFYNIYNNAK